MYNQISIVGGSGSGKSTLCNIISKELNLPAIHLDVINYEPNWVEIDKAERDKIISDKSNEDKWIIDGNYNKGLWRKTVSCWIINEKGEILLQKRTANKLKNPNKWAKTGGQVDSGETVEEAIFREVKEKLGIFR